MEIIDIDLETGTSGGGSDPSVNFGSGIELLMNEKKKSGSNRVDLGELDNLEAELNNLSETNVDAGTSNYSASSSSTKTVSGVGGGFSNFFNFGGGGNKSDTSTAPPAVNDQSYDTDANLGLASKDVGGTTGPSTWDGFAKVTGDIPRPSSNLTEREKRRKKRLMIKKLEEWRDKGLYKGGTQFDMESNYDEIEDEYEGALEDKRKKDSVKLQGWWFTTAVSTLEYGNALLNPFDLNLDGWGEQVSEDLDSYEDIFAELHEKYKGGKMAPEVSLLLRIGFSAAVVNMSNKMLSSAAPGFKDVMKQSPDLMKMFSNAAVDTMSQQNSAFDFARTMMKPPEEVNTTYGPPPAPIKTQNLPPPQRPGTMQYTPAPGNRPDLARAQQQQQQQQPMFREQGIDMNQPSTVQQAQQRPEMRGPPTNDIDDLLSGLKKKTGGVPQQQQQQQQQQMMSMGGGDDSIISVSSLTDMKKANMPKKVQRRSRNNSDKNTVSLDI